MNRDIRFPSLPTRGAAIMGALAAYITPLPLSAPPPPDFCPLRNAGAAR